MNKLALVGKDITHSRSPEMYRKLMSPSISYDLLDYKTPNDIPSAIELLAQYDGINITSPYKKHFLNQIQLTEVASKLGAVNCLKKIEGKIVGENTDYLAIVDILKKLFATHGILKTIILGDGVMSFVTEMALRDLGFSYEIFSRKKTENFNQVNLKNYFDDKNDQPLIINTCAREYIFTGEIPKKSIFWDFNYNFSQHSFISNKVHLYMDGLEMLERQAFHAVAFWSSHNLPKYLK